MQKSLMSIVVLTVGTLFFSTYTKGEEISCFRDTGPKTCPVIPPDYCVIAGGLCPVTQTQSIAGIGNNLDPGPWFPVGSSRYGNDGSVTTEHCKVTANCTQIRDENGNLINCGTDLTSTQFLEPYLSGHVNYDNPCLTAVPIEPAD